MSHSNCKQWCLESITTHLDNYRSATKTASLADTRRLLRLKDTAEGQMHQSSCTARQRLNLQPTPDYRHWLWDNKQWHHTLCSGMRGSIFKKKEKVCWLTPGDAAARSHRLQVIPAPPYQFFLTCVLTFPIHSEQRGKEEKNRVIKNKHDHNFFFFWAKLFQWIDINTDSHEPMITLFMEHTC